MSQDLMNPNDFIAGLTSAVDTISSSTGGMGTLLRLLKSGDWVYGPEDIDVEKESQWAINPASIKQGFICWGEGEVLGESMVSVTSPPIIKADLKEYGAPWKPQVAFDLKCLSGEDKGESVVYKVTSVGGLKACQAVITAILKQIQGGADKFVPIVTLGVDSYKHKEYGRIYTPQLTIVKWTNMDVEPVAETPKKVTRTAAKKEPEVVEQVEEDDVIDAEIVEEQPAPTRRRRRA